MPEIELAQFMGLSAEVDARFDGGVWGMTPAARDKAALPKGYARLSHGRFAAGTSASHPRGPSPRGGPTAEFPDTLHLLIVSIAVHKTFDSLGA